MEVDQPKTIQEYAENRTQLLNDIVQFLKKDPRFVAAWLTGSFGRHEADNISDLDLTVIVDNASAQELCAQLHSVGAGTTQERYALFSQFGQPHIIHENHQNAPADGTFTFVLYKDSALVVDWTLRPNRNVTRPAASLLLFDHGNLEVDPPVSAESLPGRIEMTTEQVAFFWMMVTVAIKYFIRRDKVYFHRFLNLLHGILWNVRRLVAGEPYAWRRESFLRTMVAPAAEITALRQVCYEMLDVMQDVEKLGGTVPDSPMSTIEILLHLARQEIQKEN